MLDKPQLKKLPKQKTATPGPSLTFSDGLNFGCGFFVAGFLFSVLFLPLATVAMYEMDQGPASAKDRQPVPLISRKE